MSEVPTFDPDEQIVEESVSRFKVSIGIWAQWIPDDMIRAYKEEIRKVIKRVRG